ncbi:MAG: VWA domain-containing protein [Spirochaetaceae bacterium]
MKSPQMLWMLIILIPTGYILFLNYKRGRRELGRFKGRGPVDYLFDAFTIKWFFSSLFFVLFVIFTVFSLAGFQSDREQPEEMPSETDIMFVVDVSRSMLAEDVSPDRLSRCKSIMRGILGRVPNPRYGVTVYKGGAYTLIPITEDRSSVEASLELLSPSLLTAPGTDMEAGIRSGVDGFPEQEERRRIILLFSDGESHSGEPVDAAAYGREREVAIHVFGAGTEEGGRIPVSEEEFVRDRQGDVVVTSLRKSGLTRVADTGRGEYLSVDGTETLSEILERLELSGEDGKIRYIVEGRYKLFLLIAIVFLFLSILVKVLPWRGTF